MWYSSFREVPYQGDFQNWTVHGESKGEKQKKKGQDKS
jgi:hypothetical protein